MNQKNNNKYYDWDDSIDTFFPNETYEEIDEELDSRLKD